MLLRRAAPQDSTHVLRWRNEDSAVAASITRRAIPRVEHDAWFDAALRDPLVSMYMAVDPADDEPIGVCRFNVSEDGWTAITSINVDPSFRGMGAGQRILTSAIRALIQERPSLGIISARVRGDNVPSLRLFATAGFRQVRAENDVHLLEYAVRP